MLEKTKQNFLASLVIILGFSSMLLADVPPDPGYQRQSANLVLETDSDLSGYRFFLTSPMNVEEIKIVTGSPTIVSASRRAGAMRFGELIAIPAGEVEQFRDRLTEDEFREALREKKLTATQLLSHNFQTTIPEGANFKDPVYRIEKEGETGLKAVQISGGTSVAGGAPTSEITRALIWAGPGAAIIAGFFLLSGLAILGIWYFRRSSRHP